MAVEKGFADDEVAVAVVVEEEEAAEVVVGAGVVETFLRIGPLQMRLDSMKFAPALGIWMSIGINDKMAPHGS